jgi:hypothetical protein
MPLILPGNVASATAGGYEVANSVKMDGGNSEHMERDFGAPTDAKKWTFSTWFKSGTATGRHIFGVGDTDQTGSGHSYIGLVPRFYAIYYDGTTYWNHYGNDHHRDVSAWMHIMVTFDSAQGVADNRLKSYVNGVLLADFNPRTNPDQNFSTAWNNDGITHYLGRRGQSQEFANGSYLAETAFFDGQAYSPSDVGEFDEDSPAIFKPKDLSGLTFGDNGFWLDYEDSSALGNDISGNNNDWTLNNVAAVDQKTDSPTNNFCTINSLFADSGNNIVQAAFSEGNTKMLTTVDGWKFGRGTFLLTSGKWYAEAKVTEASAGQNGNFGIVPSQGGIALGESDDNAVFEGLRAELGGSDTILRKLDTGTGTEIFNDLASGDIVMLAIDLDNNKLWVGKEGTWYNDNNASTTLDASNHDVGLPTVTEGWLFGVGQYRDGSNNLTWEYNWGNPPHTISSGNADANGYGNFEFAVPSGFYAPCTKNLAEFG